MRAAITLTAALAFASCGTPPYCDGDIDTRKEGVWSVTHDELSGDCGPIDDVTFEYPNAVPQGAVRYQAWLQDKCGYEGSHSYHVVECVPIVPRPEEPPFCLNEYTHGYVQVAQVVGATKQRIVGRLTLTMHEGPALRDDNVLCESEYEVTLTRLD